LTPETCRVNLQNNK